MRSDKAPFTITHHGEALSWCDSSLLKALAKAVSTVVVTTLDGDIYETLQSYKQDHDIDLMIMGAFAHSKVRHLFLGSNTLRMIERTDIPLIVLR